MALQIVWKLFLSTFVLIFVAALPDKTVLQLHYVNAVAQL